MIILKNPDCTISTVSLRALYATRIFLTPHSSARLGLFIIMFPNEDMYSWSMVNVVISGDIVKKIRKPLSRTNVGISVCGSIFFMYYS